MTTLPRPCVYLVTDRRQLAPDARTTRNEIAALESFLDDAVDAGVDAIQIRERDLDGGPLVASDSRECGPGRRARRRWSSSTIAPMSRWPPARTASIFDADGPPIARVRALSPESWIVGRSVHAAPEARDTSDAGADYVLFGTVFGGGSKGEVADGDRVSALEDAARSSRRTGHRDRRHRPRREPICRRAGAAGVAAISIFLPEGRAPLAIGVARGVAALREAMID